MTDKEMTIEEALALAVDYMSQQYNPPTVGNSDELRQAAAVLRQIGKPVERRIKTHDRDMNPVIRRWTETTVLKRVIETSAPVYEPVESKERDE